MRKLISGMKVSLDGRINGAGGADADWVETWSDEYGMMERVDACVLGGGMYSGYEPYWDAIHEHPDRPNPETGRPLTPGEIQWAHFAAHTPHHVLSRRPVSAKWSDTRILQGVEDVAELKRQPGKDIYLVGGAETVAGLVNARLVDELQLIVYPLVSGEGKPLFGTAKLRRDFEFRDAEPLSAGRVRLTYALA